MNQSDSLPVINERDASVSLKPAVNPRELKHKELLDGDFWRKIPAYMEVGEELFLDYKWQAKNLSLIHI